MTRTVLVHAAIAGVVFKFIQTECGFEVSRTAPKPDMDSVSIERWKYASYDGRQAATRMMSEFITSCGEVCQQLRRERSHAVDRAIMARSTMRPGSSAVRLLITQGQDAAKRYASEGRALIDQCSRLEERLIAAGCPPYVGTLPLWMDELLDEPAPEGVATRSLASSPRSDLASS